MNITGSCRHPSSSVLFIGRVTTTHLQGGNELKKVIWVLLAVLLLSGCAGQAPETTAPSTTAATEATGIYVADSQAELDTNGAVRAYVLTEDYSGLAKMGSKLLLLSGGRMDAFSGDELIPAGSLTLGDGIPVGTAGVSIGQLGVSYYDESKNAVVCLNPVFATTNTVLMPDEISGVPAVCPETGEIYYSTGQELRALNMQNGISRLVRSMSGATLSVEEVYFDGKLLKCGVITESAVNQTVYISAETGQTLSEDQNILSLQTQSENYFLRRMDGTTEQLIYGTFSGKPAQLHITGSFTGLPGLNRVLSWEGTQDGLTLTLYDLDKGTVCASVSLGNVPIPVSVLEDPETGYLWLLTEAGEKMTLYRWDPTQTPSNDTQKYTTDLYTAENPDTQGLELCQQRVEALNEQYGVQIAIWEDALAEQGEYSFTAEYQTGAVNTALDDIEDVLAIFPEDIFSESMPDGGVRVNLVRSIATGEKAVHYWKDKSIHIALTADGDLGSLLLRQIAFAIDSHCTVYSKNYDLWNKLNPSGFTYDLDYVLTEQRDDTEYLTGEGRAFADKRSMSFASEDRCAIFVYACQADAAELFEAPILQEKLYQICTAIREAYGLEDHPEAFLWERYLEEPLVETD